MRDENDLKFSKLSVEYSHRFNRSYGVEMFDPTSIEEHIRRMEEALKTGVPVESNDPPPEPNIYI